MKKKNIIVLVLCCISYLGASAQIVKEKKSVSPFTKISSSLGIVVKFTQGNSHSLEIEAQQENISKVDFKVEDDTFIITLKQDAHIRNSTITAYVSAPTLDEIMLDTGGRFESGSVKYKGDFSISAHAGGNLDIDKLEASEIDLSISSGSNCRIKNLKAESLDLDLSAGSNADVTLNNVDEAEINASAGSKLIVKGKVKEASINCSGGSKGDISGLTGDDIDSHSSGESSIKK
nr:DUF2807 domain-containing protein [Prevotella sp. 10(H)]